MRYSTICSAALVAAAAAPAIALPVDLWVSQCFIWLHLCLTIPGPYSSTRSFWGSRELVARVITKPPSRPVEVKEKPPHPPKEPKSKRLEVGELIERSFDHDELFDRSFEDTEVLFERAFGEDVYMRDLEARVITKPSRPVEVKEKPPHPPKEPKSKRSFVDLVARVIPKPSRPVEIKEKPPHPPKEPKYKRSFDEEELLFERAFDEEDLWERDLEARVITKPSRPVEIKEKPPHPPKEPKSKRSFDDEELFERSFDEGDDMYAREMEYWLD